MPGWDRTPAEQDRHDEHGQVVGLSTASAKGAFLDAAAEAL